MTLDKDGHEIVGNGCECWITDEKYWFRYGSAVEPGSQVEWNPECPEHPAESGETRRWQPDHEYLPVNGHPDDDECTFRSDGTDQTYCGRPAGDHEVESGETQGGER